MKILKIIFSILLLVCFDEVSAQSLKRKKKTSPQADTSVSVVSGIKREIIKGANTGMRSQPLKVIKAKAGLEQVSGKIGTLQKLAEKKEIGLDRAIKINDLVATYSFIEMDGAGKSPASSAYYGDSKIGVVATAVGVPISFVLNNQTWADARTPGFLNARFRFDRNDYLKHLKRKLANDMDPRSLLAGVPDPAAILRREATALLEKEMSEISASYGIEMMEGVQAFGNIGDLLDKDITSLRRNLLGSEMFRQFSEKQRIYESMLQLKKTGTRIDKANFEQLEKEVHKFKGMEAMLNKVEQHRKRWDSTGFLIRIREVTSARNNELSRLLNDPGKIREAALQRLNLNSFQRLFLSIDKLSIGQNTLSVSDLSSNHLLNTGGNIRFLNNGKDILLGVGRVNGMAGLLDQPFANTSGSVDGMARMVRFGLSGKKSAGSHIAVSTFRQSMALPGSFTVGETFRTALITTFSNELNIGKSGVVATEVSRSAANYSNVESGPGLVENKSAMDRIVGNDFLRNMAFTLKYSDEIEKAGLTYKVNISKTAFGYNNPGNPMLDAGSNEAGLLLRKSFLKKKLSTMFRTEQRTYNYGEGRDRLYRSNYTLMDVKWNFKRGRSLSVRYMPVVMNRIEKGVKENVNRTGRVNLEGVYNAKISGLYYRNNINLAHQRNVYRLDTIPVNNTTLSVSSFHSLVIGESLLHFNASLDHTQNSSGVVYFNSSALMELGCSYRIMRNFNATSALAYNNVIGWYRQAGVRQSISSMLGKRWSINAFADVRHNIKVLHPLLYGTVRADVALRYSFVQ
ncbi:MAG: hypothetical protein ACO1NW_18550 [Chitinophagaceae bacterium]